MNILVEQGSRLSLDQLAGIDSSSTMAAIRGVAADPMSNTTVSVLLLAVAILAVLILALLVLAFATPSRKKIVKVRRYRGTRPAAAVQQVERAPSPQSAPRTKSRSTLVAILTSSVFVFTIALVAVVGGYVTTSSDRYCAETCHRGTRPALTGQRADHARCVSCHETSGLLGVAANVASRTRMVVAFAIGGDPSEAAAPQDSRECLSCHPEIESGVSETQEGLRMSHAEVIEAALPCTWCHARSGHVSAGASVAMAKCLPCHDSRIASAECTLCHKQTPASKVVVTGKAGGSLGSAGYVYPAVRAANRECGGCHDQERQCDPCHGIRMPHSRDFKEGAHARPAAFDAKLRCWKCHDPQWCSSTSGCHQAAFQPDTGDTTHGRGWKQEHKRAAWDAGCVCHQNRSKRAFPICFRCHTRSRGLLPIKP